MSRADFVHTRALAKRAAILRAARSHFGEAGFEGASVERIAKEAQVSTATLYRMFASKAELFTATLRAGLAEFEAALSPDAGADPRMRLQKLARAYAALLDAPGTAGMLRALMTAAPSAPILAHDFGRSIKFGVAQSMHTAAAEAGLSAGDAHPTAPGALIMGMIEHGTLWRRLIVGGDAERPVDAIADDAVAAARRAFGGSPAPPLRGGRIRPTP